MNVNAAPPHTLSFFLCLFLSLKLFCSLSICPGTSVVPHQNQAVVPGAEGGAVSLGKENAVINLLISVVPPFPSLSLSLCQSGPVCLHRAHSCADGGLRMGAGALCFPSQLGSQCATSRVYWSIIFNCNYESTQREEKP